MDKSVELITKALSAGAVVIEGDSAKLDEAKLLAVAKEIGFSQHQPAQTISQTVYVFEGHQPQGKSTMGNRATNTRLPQRTPATTGKNLLSAANQKLIGEIVGTVVEGKQFGRDGKVVATVTGNNALRGAKLHMSLREVNDGKNDIVVTVREKEEKPLQDEQIRVIVQLAPGLNKSDVKVDVEQAGTPADKGGKKDKNKDDKDEKNDEDIDLDALLGGMAGDEGAPPAPAKENATGYSSRFQTRVVEVAAMNGRGEGRRTVVRENKDLGDLVANSPDAARMWDRISGGK